MFNKLHEVFQRDLTDSETPDNLGEENPQGIHWEGILMISNILISTFPIKNFSSQFCSEQ